MWRLAESRATLETDDLSASVDLAHPALGIHDLKIEGIAIPDLRLFAIQFSDSPTESYIRGNDLIARYPHTSDETVSPQVYWRCLKQQPSDSVFGFELILSLQTSLLDSSASVEIISKIPTQSTESHFRPPTTLLRLPGDRWSYIEFVQSVDVAESRLNFSREDSLATVSYELFPERLEKGVIRCGRIWGLFVPRLDDEMTARACYEKLLCAAPPLTA